MNTNKKPTKIPKKTLIIGIIILIAVVLLTFRTILKNLDFTTTIEAIRQASPFIIPLGLLLVLAYSFLEGLNMYRVLRLTGYNTSLIDCLKYAIIGFFYSGITPSSSGGQPMQIYYMYQDNIRIAHSLCAVIMQIFGHISANVIFGLIGYPLLSYKINAAAGNFKYLIWLGLLLNSLYLVFLIICLFSQKALNGIYQLLSRIFSRIYPNGDNKLLKKILDTFTEYATVGEVIKQHPAIAAKTVLTSLVQMFCSFSVSALVYYGFGLRDSSWFEIVIMQAIVYISVGFIPIPGAAGVSEGMIYLLFQSIYPVALLGSGVLLSRCINSYFSIILYGIITIVLSKKLMFKANVQRICKNTGDTA